PPSMDVVEGHQSVPERRVGGRLQARVEAGPNRQSALVEPLLAVAGEQLAPHLFGEVWSMNLFGGAASAPVARFGLRRPRLVPGRRSVLEHASDDPVAPALGQFWKVPWVVAVWRFRQPGEKGGLGEAQLIERLVEITLRCCGNAIIATAEIDLVQIEFEDAVF